MLVWDGLESTPNILAMSGVNARRDARSAYEGFLCSVNRILLRDCGRLDFLPTKLSAAMIGAF
jgi:hypothetical protein